MKTARMIICLLTVVFVALIASPSFAQQFPEPYHTQIAEIAKKRAADQDDIYWGWGNWRFRAYYKPYYEKHGGPLYPPKTLYEWLDDTRQTFKKAEEKITSDNIKGAKELLDACQKIREAGIVFEACYKFYPREVCLAAYTGPFFSQDGRDDKFMVQIFCVKAYDNWTNAYKEYSKTYSKSSEKARLEVLCAIFDARDKAYEVDFCQLWFKATGLAPKYNDISSAFVGYFYLRLGLDSSDNGDCLTIDKEMQKWKSIFKNLSDLKAKEWKLAPLSSRPKLVMDRGGLEMMIPKEEFLFLWPQADQAFRKMLDGPIDDLPKYEYWQRDPDADEPSLLLKAPVSFNPYRDGSAPTYGDKPNPSLLFEELCPEWKAALGGPDSNPGSMFPDALYERYFAKERLKWHRISVEDYAKLKSDQVAWSNAHPESAFNEKQKACDAFQQMWEKLAEMYKKYEPGQTVEHNNIARSLASVPVSNKKTPASK